MNETEKQIFFKKVFSYSFQTGIEFFILNLTLESKMVFSSLELTTLRGNAKNNFRTSFLKNK